jgi:hypothetical protein
MEVDRNALPKWEENIQFLYNSIGKSPTLDEEDISTCTIIGPKERNAQNRNPLFVSDVVLVPCQKEAKLLTLRS